MVEHPLVFECVGERLVGVLALPATPARTGVVIVVGGPQYRAGSHRQFVLLARSLADAGFATLRFDYRGMGDAEGVVRSFEEVSDDIDAAVAALRGAVPTVATVVLWGLCDGASAALLSVNRARQPPNIREGTAVFGLVLVNPWVRSDATYAKTRLRYYYLRRVLDRAFWAKLLRGNVRVGTSLGDLGRAARAAAVLPAASIGATETFHERMLAGFASFSGSVLVLTSGRDLTAREFEERTASDRRWQRLLRSSSVSRAHIADADHTFSSERSRLDAERVTIEWLRARLEGASSNAGRSTGGDAR